MSARWGPASWGPAGRSHLHPRFRELTERADTLRTVLARSVAAIDRLGFAEWLDAL
jgi:hypothetical protein